MNTSLLITVVTTSAAVSTAFATGVTLYLRFRERPEPDWVVTGFASFGHAESGSSPDVIDLTANLTNVGDGPAFRVVLGGVQSGFFHRDLSDGRRPLPVQDAFLSLVEPGGSHLLWAKSADGTWDNDRITLQWTRSPARKGKRVIQQFRLSESFKRPTTSGACPPSILRVIAPQEVTGSMPRHGCGEAGLPAARLLGWDRVEGRVPPA